MDELKNYSPPVLLFDEECVLCNRFKQALDRIPGTELINKVSIHDKKIYQIYPELSFEKCNETLHLISENNEILIGPDALEYLISKFPAVKRFSWLYESNMGKKAIDIFYKVADNYRKSKLNRCEGCKRSRYL